MSLPFKEIQEKVWMCFVCGMECLSYEEYRDHILENHDEGDEYLRCPECDAPVRDMLAHYRVRHKGAAMPRGVQTRVTSWYDFGAKGRRRKKVNFKSGDFVSVKNNGAAIHYRSGLELEFYELLERSTEVVAFHGEPVEIPYQFEGEQRRYRPDLLVVYADGHREMWEFKPKSQTTLPINRCKWDAAAKWCEEREVTFKVLTEVGLGRLRRKVLRD